MKKTRIRLKTLSVIMVLILLFNAFPAVYAEKDAVGSQAEDVYELPPEEIFPSEGVASSLFEHLSKASSDPKYKNYTVEKMPETLKTELGIKEGEVVFDVSRAEDLYSLTLVSRDGTKTLKVFNEPIKYINTETNTVEFIDNSLTPSEDGENALECTTNSSKAYFPKDINDGIKLNKGKNSVTMTPVNTEVKKNGKVKIKKIKFKKSDCAQYEDVFGEDTLLQYSPTALGIKENIVLEKYNGVNEFNYLIDSGKLVPKENEGTEIIFIDPETEEEVFKIEETFIYDADFDNKDASNNHISFNNHYVIEEQKNGKYLLTTVVDKEFLESEETIYPVVIDPMAEWISEENLFTCFSFSEYDDAQSENLWLGSSENWITYVKFSEINHLAYINPQLVEQAELLVTFNESSETNGVVRFSFPFSNTDEIFFSGTYCPSYQSYLEKANYSEIATLSALSICGIDFKNHLVSYLELYDEEEGNYYPGFFLNSYFYTPFFEINNLYLNIEYREDNELRDDLYFIKNDTDYLRAVESNGTIYAKWEDLDGEEPSKAYNDGYLWYVYSDKLSDLYYIKSYKQFDGNRKHYLCDRENSITVESEITGSDWEKQCWYILKNHDGSYRVMNGYIDNTPVDALTKGSSGNLSTSEFRYNSNQKWSFVRYGEREQATTKICTTAEWPTEAATSTINLLKGKTPTVLEYDVSGSMATLGTGTAYPFVGQTNTNGSAMTDGLINGDNVDIRSYTLTQYGENGYIRYINRKDGTYREKGELYLDIVYKLDEIKNLGSLWFATNTQNNDYQVGAFEVYVSQSPETIFFTKNRRATVDKTSGRWSGVACIEFPENVEGDYIGIRVTQGVVQKANNEAWPRSELEHAYARIRDIVLLEQQQVVTYPIISAIEEGETLQINATVYPIGDVQWTSLNEEVATVDDNGKVTAIKSGVAKISATVRGKTTISKIMVLSTAQNESVVDGGVYKMLETSSEQAIQSEDTSISLEQFDKTEVNQKFKFKYVSNGQYKIFPKGAEGTEKIIAYNAGDVSIVDNTDALEAKWFLVPYDSEFIIINAAHKTYCLAFRNSENTNQATIMYCDEIKTWDIRGYEVSYASFFDRGMMRRWEDSHGEISEEDMKVGIDIFFKMAQDKYKTLGGEVNVEIDWTNNFFKSLPDVCDEDLVNRRELGGLEDDCPHLPYKNHNYIDEIEKYEEERIDNLHIDGVIPIFWTGHETLSYLNDELMEISMNKGLTKHKNLIFMLNVGDSGDLYQPGLSGFLLRDEVLQTLLHEMAHTLGAGDSYCVADISIDGECENENCTKHSGKGKGYSNVCLMSNGNMDAIQEKEGAQPLICDRCLQDIENYLLTHF